MRTTLLARLTLAAFVAAGTLPGNLKADSVGAEMAQAANAFLNSLTADQKGKATYEMKDPERVNWHFIPKTRNGLPVKDMTMPQRLLAHALLNTGLSQRGYAKAVTIMSLEDVLRGLEKANPKMTRDPELYFFTIFGKPAMEGTWGWRVEGHHLSVNFTLVNGREISTTPAFMGTNPAEVRTGPRAGLRVLGTEEELGRSLAKSLDDTQRAAGIFTNVAPKDIITMADRTAKRLPTSGITAAKLNKEQKEILVQLIKEYLYRNRAEVAAIVYEKIQRAGFDKIQFAWAGPVEPKSGHYYMVQGPTFLLEYDNTQNEANHVHSVWRDFNGDFGDDILAAHYQQDHKK